ncbi:unnamed protein product [Clonostachys byssicola]|uniref:BZIP domain-containing protein n=1 Tax=Clonostachys byssicola TaxID=160290 RepID=A0A9N9XXY5_9HYPO|nr:unnamed protein product [Clonostachys byssicola]
MRNNPHACHPPQWMLATSQPGDHCYGSQASQYSYAGTSGPLEAIFTVTSTPTATSPPEYRRVFFEETIPLQREDPYTPISKHSDRPVASTPSPPYDESSRQTTISVPVTDNSYVANYVTPILETPTSDDAPKRWHGWQATPTGHPHVYYNQYASLADSPFPITPQQESSSKLPLSTVEPIKKKKKKRRGPEQNRVNPPHAPHPRSPQRPREIPRTGGDSTYFKDDAARQRALERNRLAANRCRHRQRRHTKALTSVEFEVEDQHKYLSGYLQSLSNEVLDLKSELLRHTNCNCTLIQTYLGYEAMASVNNKVGAYPNYGTSAASSTVECLGLLSSGANNGPSHWVNPHAISHQPQPTLLASADQSHSADFITVSNVISSAEPAAPNTTQLPPQQVFTTNSSPYTTSGVYQQSPYNNGLWGPQ